MIGIIINALQLVHTRSSAISIVILWNWHRAWTFPLAAVYIKSRFSNQYFGRLLGTVRLIMGISVMIVIGLAEAPKTIPEDGFKGVAIALMIATVLSFAFPLSKFINILKVS